MKFSFLTILLLFTWTKCFSQLDESTEDFIVLHSGEKIYGSFTVKEYSTPLDQINFIKQGENESRIYGPSDVEYFQSNKVRFMSTINFSNIEHPQFIQVLVDGPKSLYFIKLTNGKNLFFINHENELLLLESERMKSEFDGDPAASLISTKFRNQLSVYLKDCDKAVNKISVTKYSKNSLIKLFESYYECHEKNGFIGAYEESSKSVDVIIGISTLNYSFKQFEHRENLISTNFGIGIQGTLPGTSKKWSLRAELIGSRFYSDLDYTSVATIEEITSAPGGFLINKYVETTPNSSRYSSILLSLNTMAVYRIGKNKELLAGASNMFGLPFESPEITYTSFLDGEYVWSRDESPRLKFYSPGLILGYTQRFNKFGASIRYTITQGPYTDYAKRENSNSSNLSSLNFHFSYDIK